MSKKRKIIIAAAIVVLLLGFSGGQKEDKKETASVESVETTVKEEPSIVEEEKPAVKKEPSAEEEKSGLPDLTFHRDVPGDKTGNWHWAVTADPAEVKDYALEYYKQYFKSDSELHIIINYSANTTTVINCLGGMLDVTVHEYVKDEERSADTLCEGAVLSEYMIYASDGGIEKIQ